jgi:hypothetical protein
VEPSRDAIGLGGILIALGGFGAIVGGVVSLANPIVVGLWIIATAGFVLIAVGILIGIRRDIFRRKRHGN